MLFDLKALASALLAATAVLGAAVESTQNLQKRAQPKGIDVSSHQGDINWNTVVANGVSFAFIKATEGTSKGDSAPVLWNADISFQPTRTLTPPPSTPVPPTPVSFVAAITLPFPIGPLVRLRPTSLPPTVVAGVATASLSQVPSTSNVRAIVFNSLVPPIKHPSSIKQITHTALLVMA